MTFKLFGSNKTKSVVCRMWNEFTITQTGRGNWSGQKKIIGMKKINK
jgi:hypothetical protein